MLLFGIPGSGKGTQGKALGSVPGFLHVASGEIFRQLNKQGMLGREVARYTDNGKLVPDNLTIDIWRDHMRSLEKHGTFHPDEQIILMDGIPRTYQQAEHLAADIEVVSIFSLEMADEEEAVARIKARALKEDRVDDADEGVIRSRLATFHRETAETLSFYDPGLITRINAAQPPMKVLLDLASHICGLVPNAV